MNDLSKLLKTTQNIEATTRSEKILVHISILEGDIAASNHSFPIVVFSPTTADGERIREVLARTGIDSSPVIAKAFRSITQWPSETFHVIDRARLLVISSTANQLVPSKLAEVLNYAGSYSIPVLFYVNKMGRIADPDDFSVRVQSVVSQSIKGSLPKVTCLNDSPRYKASTLEEAITRDYKEFESSEYLVSKCKARLLTKRSQDILEVVIKIVDQIRRRKSIVRSELHLIQDVVNGLEILAGAEATSSAGRLKEIGRAVSEIDIEGLWHEVMAAAGPVSDESLLNAYRDVLTEKVHEALSERRKSVERTLEHSGDDFFQHLSLDLTRMLNRLQALLSNSNLTIDENHHKEVSNKLREDRLNAIDRIILSCNVAIKKTCEGFSAHMFKMLRTKIGKNSAEDYEDEEENDNSNEKPSIGKVINPWLNKAEEMVLRSKTEEVLQEVLEVIRLDSETAAKRWKGILSEHVENSFHEMNGLLINEKLQTEKSLNRLRVALEMIE